ncbi:hypothetical protein RND71_003190 [Anisodus tanguticus]|uniref:Uncharacterized protein n=1 Tax=Anisodus tanguticus TaxID=243964 RepID=A0AAE1SVZ8_9SOLA|nr:hypothetical protein RND71_003190 [Anisodus tanguticus]
MTSKRPDNNKTNLDDVERIHTGQYYLKDRVQTLDSAYQKLFQCITLIKTSKAAEMTLKLKRPIWLSVQSSGSTKKGDMVVNVDHFDGPGYRTQGLNKLQKLKIGNFHGSRTELLFRNILIELTSVTMGVENNFGVRIRRRYTDNTSVCHYYSKNLEYCSKFVETSSIINTKIIDISASESLMTVTPTEGVNDDEVPLNLVFKRSIWSFSRYKVSKHAMSKRGPVTTGKSRAQINYVLRKSKEKTVKRKRFVTRLVDEEEVVHTKVVELDSGENEPEVEETPLEKNIEKEAMRNGKSIEVEKPCVDVATDIGNQGSKKMKGSSPSLRNIKVVEAEEPASSSKKQKVELTEEGKENSKNLEGLE